MSREFIDAIASGNNLEAEDEFKNSISSKVGDALEFRRKEISQTFAGNNELVEEDSKPYVKQKPDGTWCVYDAEGNIVSEHESEDEAKAALPNKKYEDDEEDDEVDEGIMIKLKRPPKNPAQSAPGAARTMAATEKGITQQKRTADAERSFQRKMNPPKSKKAIAQSLPDGGSPAPKARGAMGKQPAPKARGAMGKPSKSFAKKDVWA